MKDVRGALEGLPKDGVRYFFTEGSWDNIIADLGHIQGMAYFRPEQLSGSRPNTTVVFSVNVNPLIDDPKPGRLVFYSLYTGNPIGTIELPTSTGTHPGGIQVIGDFLVVPVEPLDKTPESTIYLIDMSAETPVRTNQIRLSGKAGAAGAALVGDRHYVVAYDNGVVSLYRSNGEPLGSNALSFQGIGSVEVDETGCSSVNLVVQKDSKTETELLFMLGFENSGGKDLVHMYEVKLGDGRVGIQKVKSQHFVANKVGGVLGDLGVSFRWGASAYIDPRANLNLVACQRNSNAGVTLANAWSTGTGEVDTIGSWRASDGQKSRVSENFPMTGPKDGHVQWHIGNLKPEVDTSKLTFAIMKDKKHKNDKAEATDLKSGSVTQANYGDSSHHLYIGRLRYEQPGGSTVDNKAAIVAVAKREYEGQPDEDLWISFRSVNVEPGSTNE